MNILYLTQRLPYPPDSGGPIKTYQTLKLLSKKHQIFLVCFSSKKRDLTSRDELDKICSQVKIIVSKLPFEHFRDIKKTIFKSIFLPVPFLVRRYQDKRFQEAVDWFLKKQKIEAIHIDHLSMAQYLPKVKKMLWVWEEHNIDSEKNWQIAAKEKLNKFKFFSALEALKFEVYQRKMIKKFDYCLAISRKDAKRIAKFGLPKKKIFILPTPFPGRNLYAYSTHKPVILFVGTLSWWPNKVGLYWFIRKVFPLIQKDIPQVKFLVIGGEAPDELKELAQKDSGIKLLGYVKNIEPFFKKTSVFVVPLRAGSGIRIKILTSLAAGIPVVSTPIGAEGIEVINKNEAMLADSSEKFAQAVVKVIKNKNLALKLSAQGQAFIKKYYNQKSAQAVLDKVYVK